MAYLMPAAINWTQMPIKRTVSNVTFAQNSMLWIFYNKILAKTVLFMATAMNL